MTSTAFEAAKQKLESGNPPLTLTNLPINVHSPLWSRVESTYGLTLGETIALQNFVEQQQTNRTAEKMEEVIEFVLNQKAEAETLIISDPKTERFNTAMNRFDYKKDAAKWVDKPGFIDPRGQPHTWLKSKEDSPENRAAYMVYLRNSDNIKLPQDTQLFEGSSEKDLLSVKFFGFGNVKTSGNIDVVLASSHHQSIATVRQNILVGIELKKDTNAEHSKIERQVTLQHLAASYLNPDAGILTMMTDLHNRWHFFWFAEGKRLMRYEATRPEAMFLIQHSQDGEVEKERVSTPTSFLNRACWNDLFFSRLDSIAEVKSFEERDGEDEDSEERSDGNGRGKHLSETGGKSISQEGTFGGSGRTRSTSRHGKSSGSQGSDRKHAQMGDTSLEYMDEEERFEATLRRELQTSFHKMLYVPEVKEQHSADVLPREISLG